MSSDSCVTVRFYPPPDDLRRFFTTFYITEIDPGSEPEVRDSLHPEWAGMRIFEPVGPRTWNDAGERIEGTRFVAQGPSSHPIHFLMPKVRMWGFGILPLGWARYFDLAAADFANRICDGFTHPGCRPFVPLAQTLFADHPDEPAELARLIAFFRAFPKPQALDEGRITAIHTALVDPELATVQELVRRVGASQRTVERLCHRYFGFSPKLLLRRQRFMRSLAQFLIDPSLKWIGAIDNLYHDQAQFVRDFHEFMGMTPREYAATPHPVLDRIAQERNKIHGSAVQTLDRPGGLGPDSA